MGRQLNAYIDDRLYVEEVTPWARRYAEHVEVGIDTVDDLEAEVVRRPPTKLVLVTSAADVERSCRACRSAGAGRLYVVRSQPEYIEFVDAAVSKSGALAWLCERLGVDREARGHARRRHERRRHARSGPGSGVAVAEAAEPGARGGRPGRAARRACRRCLQLASARA